MARQIPDGIRDYPFDLIVIGAGINGAGIARDAAMRDLKVLLLDKGDISDGTTQWSTRLIHGGVRYLEDYEVHLVRESLAEREKLLKSAPPRVRGRVRGPSRRRDLRRARPRHGQRRWSLGGPSALRSWLVRGRRRAGGRRRGTGTDDRGDQG